MSIAGELVAELTHEAINTRKILERVPMDKPEWRPHEKSMTIGRLATHIADLPVWFIRILGADEFDFATALFNRDTKENITAILQLFDERMDAAVKMLESTSDESLNAIFILRRGDQILFQMPRKVSLRNLAFNHVYHHRGQLSVYLRLLDVPVPGMYGPSADEARII